MRICTARRARRARQQHKFCCRACRAPVFLCSSLKNHQFANWTANLKVALHFRRSLQPVRPKRCVFSGADFAVACVARVARLFWSVTHQKTRLCKLDRKLDDSTTLPVSLVCCTSPNSILIFPTFFPG